MKAGGRAELHPGDDADHAEQADGDPDAQRAEVAQPFADVEADDVEREREADTEKRKCNEVQRAALQCVPARAADVECVAGGEIEHGGKVGQVAGPVDPAGEECREVAEGALGPEVQAAFLRIARGEFHDAQRQRNEDGEQADDPDDDGTGADAGGDRDPAQAQGGDHVEHDEVAEAEDALGMGDVGQLCRHVTFTDGEDRPSPNIRNGTCGLGTRVEMR